MENSNRPSFTTLLNSSNPNPNPENATNSTQQQPNSLQPQYPMNCPPQIPPSFHPQYPHMINPFGVPPNYQQFPCLGSYHTVPYHGNVGQYPPGGSQPSPVRSMTFFEGCRVSSSWADESSPGGLASPVSPAVQQFVSNPVSNEEFSESSPDECDKKGGCQNWSEEEDLRLVSAWLKNSNDPIEVAICRHLSAPPPPARLFLIPPDQRN
ncbi:hypothetical protein ACP4OV_027855 [Aristida adscensionis]